jgi:very-short-patch-repair endonuclease
MSSRTVARRIASGELVRLLPGVYSGPDPTYAERIVAVSLWKPCAVLSHDTAAWLWGLLPDEPSHVHATLPTNTTAPSWVRTYRRPVDEVVLHRGVPVVTKERCFLDVATTLDRRGLDTFFDTALTQPLQWRDLARQAAAWSGRHGIQAVRLELRNLCSRTLSEPERRLSEAIRDRGLRLELNTRVGDFYGNQFCSRARVMVEVDDSGGTAPDDWLILRYPPSTVDGFLDDVVDEIVRVVRQRRRARAAIAISTA